MKLKIAYSAMAYVVAASAAYAAVGSLISSFFVTDGVRRPYAYGVNRDPSFVFVVMDGDGADFIYRYNPSGSFVSSVRLEGTACPRGADPCHFGGTYMCVVDSSLKKLFVVNAYTGASITSFSVSAAGGPPQSVVWDGTYYYVASQAPGAFSRYTSSGASAGTWAASGWPAAMHAIGGAAFAHVARGVAGNYLVASSYARGEPSCLIDMEGGALLATWTMPALPNGLSYGAAYGDSSQPPTYGAAYWVNWSDGSEPYPRWYAFEVDIGARGGQPVVPASLGKVKAIYR